MQQNASGQRPASPWAPIVFCIVTLLMFILPTFLAPRQTGPIGLTAVDGKTVGEVTAPTPFMGPMKPDYAPTSSPEQPAWAADSGEADWAPNGIFVRKLQQVVLVLLFMAAFIGVTLRGVQKYFPALLQPARGRDLPSHLLTVLERQTVAPGVHLCVVDVGGKTMLLGYTEHGINQICELSAEEIARARELQATPGATAGAPPVRPAEVYGRILRQYLSIIPGMGAKRG